MVASETGLLPRSLKRSPDPEAGRRQRVALAHARVAPCAGPFADFRVRLALRLARLFTGRETSSAELAGAVRQVHQAAAEAQAQAGGSVWTVMEARRTAAATEAYRVARRVADELTAALGPADCLPAPEVVPVAAPAWLTTDVTALARVIARDDRPDLFPILADALEDAGCHDPRVLRHCRGPGPHDPCCWVLGLLSTEPSAPPGGELAPPGGR